MRDHVIEFGKDGSPTESDGRLDAASFHRNHQPIWGVLQEHLPSRSGDVLELGSGTGQHIVHFARHAPDLAWWPSDVHAQHLRSIEAWRVLSGLPNIRPPLRIDLSDADWCRQMRRDGGPQSPLALFCANVIHIAPWRVAEGLFAGAAQCLTSDGLMFLYGPFKRQGEHTALSNAVFDSSLRQANPAWGVRDIADLEKLGSACGLFLRETAEMLANNLILIFARAK